MRLLVLFVAATATTTSDAQPADTWYERDTGISSIHRPAGSLNIALQTGILRLLNPFDITALMDIVCKYPPLSISITPSPDYAPFLTSPTEAMTKESFDLLVQRSTPLLRHTDGRGIENRTDKLRSFQINCQFVGSDATERLNSIISALPGIGRFEAARLHLNTKLIAVRYLSRAGKPVPILTLSDDLVLIDIHNFDPPILQRDSKNELRQRRVESDLPRVCAAAMGEVFWRQISEDARVEFIRRFGADGKPVADSTNHSARHHFREAFVIAILYPTTFETEPVGAFTFPTHWPPSPPSGEFLERIRFVDALLDPIEDAFLASLPENAFEHHADEDTGTE